jgi:RNA polymerase sigma factor (sigma-70 family)
LETIGSKVFCRAAMSKQFACDRPCGMKMRERLDRFAKDSFPALCSGHKRTWDAFVVAATPFIRAVVGRVLAASGHGNDAVADTVQNVFVRLCTNDFQLLKDYDATRASLSTWLGVISWSCANDLVRRRRIAVVALDAAPESAMAVETRHIERLRIPVTLLTGRQTQVLRLLYDEDLDVSEIAAALHISAKTIYKIHARALQRLRMHLEWPPASRPSSLPSAAPCKSPVPRCPRPD